MPHIKDWREVTQDQKSTPVFTLNLRRTILHNESIESETYFRIIEPFLVRNKKRPNNEKIASDRFCGKTNMTREMKIARERLRIQQGCHLAFKKWPF